MKKMLILFAVLLIPAVDILAGGVSYGYSHGGGHFVIGGGYRNPAHGMTRRYGAQGYHSHHGDYGSGSCGSNGGGSYQCGGYGPRGCGGGGYGHQRHSHGYNTNHTYRSYHGSGTRTIIQCDANNANCQEVKLFQSY